MPGCYECGARTIRAGDLSVCISCEAIQPDERRTGSYQATLLAYGALALAIIYPIIWTLTKGGS